MKNIARVLSIAFVALFGMSASSYAQDIIIKKNGKKVWAKIIEINDKQIKYYEYTDQGGLVFTMDRAVIREIEFESGADYEEELPGTDDSYYFDDKQNNLKINFFGIGVNTIHLTYEKSISPSSALEGSIKIFGLSLDDNPDWKGGFGASFGYKVKTGSLFKGDGYRPDHLLHGGYMRPSIGINFRNRREFYWDGNSSVEYDVRNTTLHGGIDLGKQWIFNNRLSLDVYTGFHYYAFWDSSDDIDTDRLFFDEEINAGDLFGVENRAFAFGFKIGVLFGAENSGNSKQKRRR